MLRRFGGLCGIILAAPALLLLGSAGRAQEGGRGFYVGAFGGGGGSSIENVAQIGTALFPASSGGPLNVNATGSSSTTGVGMVGVQIGHEWSGRAEEGTWGLLPAAEIEAYYLGGTQRAHLNNATTRLPEHRFDDSFPMNNAVFVTNLVLSLQTPLPRLYPYAGGGIGTACMTIHNADSPQVAPPEMGVNHFNSAPDSSSWGFAAQAKAGVRFNLTRHAYVFTEYRYLYVGSTTYIFGSTQYPTHAPTTPWTVHFSDMNNHMAVGGIGFNF